MQWLRQLGENAEKDLLAAVEKFRKLYPDADIHNAGHFDLHGNHTGGMR